MTSLISRMPAAALLAGSIVIGAPAHGAAQSARTPVAAFKKGNPCSILLPGEVGQILGVPVTMREIVDEATCSFPFDAKPGAKPAAGDPPQLTITMHWDDGPTAVAATRMTSKLFGGDAGFEKLQGIGDEAWLGPLASMLVFSKGKVGVEIDLRLIPDGREKGIRLARLIASRLP
jgi:hypothetical protein